ncbi:hypothetical protein ROZALSC1DRAFT_26151, partial [Rozella allomycis CSF55]
IATFKVQTLHQPHKMTSPTPESSKGLEEDIIFTDASGKQLVRMDTEFLNREFIHYVRNEFPNVPWYVSEDGKTFERKRFADEECTVEQIKRYKRVHISETAPDPPAESGNATA